MSESNDTPTLPEIIRTQVGRVLDGMRGAMPGRVLSYDATKQEASVQPLLKVPRSTETGERQADTLPVINHVPVIFPGSGSYGMTWPIAKGETVLLVFAEQSLDKWLVNDGIIDPQSARRFHITDAIAIPGLRSFRNPKSGVPTGAMAITAPTEVRLGENGAAQKSVRGDAFDTALGNLLSLLSTFAGTCTVSDGGVARTALTTAISLFSVPLTSKVKVP